MARGSRLGIPTVINIRFYVGFYRQRGLVARSSWIAVVRAAIAGVLFWPLETPRLMGVSSL